MAGPVWATLRVQPRGGDPATGSVGHVAVYLHDGQRWRTAQGAPYFVFRPAPASDAEGWTRVLQRFAASLAALPPDEILVGVAATSMIESTASAYR